MMMPADVGIRNISKVAAICPLKVKLDPPSVGNRRSYSLMRASCFSVSSENIIGDVNLPQRKEEWSPENPRRVSGKLHN